MTPMIRVGAYHYNALPATAFDRDWQIGQEPALRWFSRACGVSGKLTSFRPGGAPSYDTRRTTFYTREDYLTWAYADEQSSPTAGCYFSPNLFYQWRKQAQLKGFCANWLEIDTKGHDALSEKAAAKVEAEVAEVLWNSGLPMPTCMVLTGSGGIHLYWRYDAPVMTQSRHHREQLLAHWRTMNQQLVKTFEACRKSRGYLDWFVDRAASNNASGVMRVPGSLHGKTGRIVQYLRGGETYPFETFAQTLGLKAKAPKADETITTSRLSPKPPVERNAQVYVDYKRQVPASRNNAEKGQAQGYDSPAQQRLFQSIMVQWEAHLKAIGGLRPREGRDLTVFHLYNCARRIMSPELAWSYIERINRQYVHYSEHQLRAYLGTAMQKIYYYSTTKLLHILRTEPKLRLVFAFGDSRRERLTPQEVAERQSNAGKVTSQRLRERSLRALVGGLTQLLGDGRRSEALTKTEALRTTGLSRATVYRYWDAALAEIRKLEIPTLSDLFSAAQKCLNRSPLSYNAQRVALGGVSLPSPCVALSVTHCPICDPFGEVCSHPAFARPPVRPKIP